MLDGRINGKEDVEWIRAMVAERINAHLAQAYMGEATEHRSLAAPVKTTSGQSAFAESQSDFEQLLKRYRRKSGF